jgi:hypothetical protein
VLFDKARRPRLRCPITYPYPPRPRAAPLQLPAVAGRAGLAPGPVPRPQAAALPAACEHLEVRFHDAESPGCETGPRPPAPAGACMHSGVCQPSPGLPHQCGIDQACLLPGQSVEWGRPYPAVLSTLAQTYPASPGPARRGQVINAMGGQIERQQENNACLAYWLSNTVTLLYLLQRNIKPASGGAYNARLRSSPASRCGAYAYVNANPKPIRSAARGARPRLHAAPAGVRAGGRGPRACERASCAHPERRPLSVHTAEFRHCRVAGSSPGTPPHPGPRSRGACMALPPGSGRCQAAHGGLGRRRLPGHDHTAVRARARAQDQQLLRQQGGHVHVVLQPRRQRARARRGAVAHGRGVHPRRRGRRLPPGARAAGVERVSVGFSAVNIASQQAIFAGRGDACAPRITTW